MFPENRLSTNPHITSFPIPVKAPQELDKLEAWELGALGLNDPTYGMLYQLWHAFLEIDEGTNIGTVWVESDTTTPVALFSALGITEIDLAFDQNMNPFVTYCALGIWKYWWYDSLIPGMRHSTLAGRDAKCTLDNHAVRLISLSDICLCYINASNKLCLRYQRDRFSIEYDLGKTTTYAVIHICMNNALRVQIGIGIWGT